MSIRFINFFVIACILNVQTVWAQYMTGTQETIAGNPTSTVFDADGGPAINTAIGGASYFTQDRFTGDLYFTDRFYNVVRRVDAKTGIITKVAGTYVAGYSGNNGLAINAKLSAPEGIVQDSKGNLYVAELSNNCIRKISPSGVISHFAGQGPVPNFWTAMLRPPSPDGSRADTAFLLFPNHLLIDSKDNIYVQANGIIYKIDTFGYINAVAGTHFSNPAIKDIWDIPSPKATEVEIGWVLEMKLDSLDKLYFSSSHGDNVHNLWYLNSSNSLKSIFGFSDYFKYIQSFLVRNDGKIIYAIRSNNGFQIYDTATKTHSLFHGGGSDFNDGANAFNSWTYGYDMKYINGNLTFATGNRIRFIYDPYILGYVAQYCKDAVAKPFKVWGKNLVFVKHNSASLRDTLAMGLSPIPDTKTTGYFAPRFGAYPSYSVHSIDTIFGRYIFGGGLEMDLWVDNFAGPSMSLYSTKGSEFLCRSSKLEIEAYGGTPDYPATLQWFYEASKIDTPSSVWKQKRLIDSAGLWKVIATDTRGCKSEKSLYIQKDTSVLPVLTPTFATICPGSSALLTCHPGYIDNKFQWLFNGLPVVSASTSSNILSVTDTGVFKVAVTNKVGCIDTTFATNISYFRTVSLPSIVYSKPTLSVDAGFMYYQWYFNGKPILGANRNIYNSLTAGLYTVMVTDKNGCDHISLPFEILKELGIGGFEYNTDISVSPNPSSGLFKISGNGFSNYSIYNNVGQLVLNSSQKEIDLNNYPSGIYILKISTLSGQFKTIKLFKN